MDREDELGSARETFVGWRPSWRSLGLTLMIGCFLLTGPLWAGYADDAHGTGFLRCGAPVIGGLLVIWQVGSWRRGRRRRLSIHDHGFDYREGRQRHVVCFAHVTSFSFDVVDIPMFLATVNLGSVKVGLDDGKILRINPRFENVSKLGELLVAHTRTFIVRDILARLRQGNEVDCGALVLGPTAVKGKRTCLAYEDILWVSEVNDVSIVSDPYGIPAVQEFFELHGPDDQCIRVKTAKVRNQRFIDEVIQAMKQSPR